LGQSDPERLNPRQLDLSDQLDQERQLDLSGLLNPRQLDQLDPELPNQHQSDLSGLSDLLVQHRPWHQSDRALLTVHLWHQSDRLGHPDQSGLLFHSDRLARSGHLDLYFLLDL
jgi:hypothetical protein